MGVKLLIRTQPAKGVSGPAHYDLLKRLVDELCASQLSGRSEAWAVTCQLLKQGNVLVGVTGGSGAGGGGGSGQLRDTWAVSFREAPDLVYLLLRPDCKVLECESAVMRVLEKKLEYSKQMAVRLEGHTFSKGDFLIRLCTATQAIHSTQALVGHCLEVEYLPVNSIASAEGMMAEFVELMRQHLQQAAVGAGLAAAGGDGRTPALQLELVKPAYDKYGLSSMSYGRAHAAVAYSDLAVTMLGSSAAALQQAAQQQQQTQQQQQPASVLR